MAARLTWGSSGTFSGLRPFNLRRDLPSVVDLVILAFANEPARGSGPSPQEDLRSLKHVAPLIWLSSLVSHQARDLFLGFVWEENGKVVGNASISKMGRDRSRWMIGNVGVDPDYRRRGIARQLTLAAIDLARAHGGRFAVLDVRANNKPAYDLYRDLGFEQFAGTAELKLTRRNGPSVGGTFDAEASQDRTLNEPPPVSLTFRELSWLQWRPIFELARAASSPGVETYYPIRETEYETRFAREAVNGLSNLFARNKEYRVLALDRKRPAAYLNLSIQGDKLSHRLRTIVHPEYRGRLEPALVSKAMEILRVHPWNSIWAEIPSEHSDQLEALKKRGFKETVTLHRLGLRL